MVQEKLCIWALLTQCKKSRKSQCAMCLAEVNLLNFYLFVVFFINLKFKETYGKKIKNFLVTGFLLFFTHVAFLNVFFFCRENGLKLTWWQREKVDYLKKFKLVILYLSRRKTNCLLKNSLFQHIESLLDERKVKV